NISYPELNNMAKKLLIERTFSSDEKSITIEDLNIFDNNGKIIVDATVSGSMKGELRLTGDPYYDPSDSTLKIKNLDFDLQTRNAIAKSANWLMHHKLAEKIQDKLNLTIAKKVEEAKQMICKMLVNKYLGHNVHLTGKLDNLYVNEIFLAKESIKANLLFKGGINLMMKR
ncbi:MAG: DUF4403 family protein, partial [Bacteroidota bacterium]|nr:DUF4403 family protein [Bacteroidota bacterium]